MTILNDAYALYDNEQSKFVQRRAFKNTVAIELSENLDFIKDALDEKISSVSIVSQLEDKEYRSAMAAGFDLNSLMDASLNTKTYNDIKEFERYKGWDTEKLIVNAYKRMSTINKIIAADESVDITKKLQYLFKYILIVVAHITNSTI